MKIGGRKSKEVGTFSIGPAKHIYGELTLAGTRSSLYLHDKEPFNTCDVRDLNGVLQDLTKVTLINCISAGPGSGGRGQERYYFANIFPHFVAFGDEHIVPTENVITEVEFVIDDAFTLFYDFDAFGSVINARPFIDEIAHANRLDRDIKTGPCPQILYFTGKHEIFETDTVLGRISASHRPTHSIGGPRGVRLKNTIVVTIAFEANATFEEAIVRTLTLTRYFGLLVGRPQNIYSLSVRLGTGGQMPAILNVYWSMPPKRSSFQPKEKPHPADVLLEPVRHPEEFSIVMGNWLDRHQAWRDARLRFFDSFAKQNNYAINRLIGAANMFDILPESAVPQDVQLSPDIKDAQSATQDRFRALPQSPERDSILGALGRMGKASLKHKVRHRAQRVIDPVGELFPELLAVTDEAVNCRNYFVHGGEPRFNYSQNFDVVTFFVDTLEFVFAASDLIESGWDIKEWSKIPSSMSHPFGRYRVGYDEGLRLLKAAIPKLPSAR